MAGRRSIRSGHPSPAKCGCEGAWQDRGAGSAQITPETRRLKRSAHSVPAESFR